MGMRSPEYLTALAKARAFERHHGPNDARTKAAWLDFERLKLREARAAFAIQERRVREMERA